MFDNIWKFFFYWRTICIFVSLGYRWKYLSIYDLRPSKTGTLKAITEQGSGCTLDPNLSLPEELTSSGGIHFFPRASPWSTEQRGTVLLPLRKPWKSRHMGPETVFWITESENKWPVLPSDPSSNMGSWCLKFFSVKEQTLPLNKIWCIRAGWFLEFRGTAPKDRGKG